MSSLLLGALLALGWILLVDKEIGGDTNSEDVRSALQPDHGVAASSSDKTGTRSAETPQQGTVRRTPIRLGDQLYPSETEDGIAWLNRNGYPTSQEQERQLGRSPVASQINIRDGATAEELLDLELLASSADEDARNEALSKLNQSAAFGSMFALELLARTHTAGPNRNFVWSEAYYRASEIRGNWGVAFRFRPRLTQTELLAAELTAQLILQNANTLRRQNGLGPLQFDPRPGLDQAIGAIRAEMQILQQASSDETGE